MTAHNKRNMMNPVFVKASPQLKGWYPVKRDATTHWEPFFFAKDNAGRWMAFEGDHAEYWDDLVLEGAIVNHTRLEPR